jgi:hypothetical protein
MSDHILAGVQKYFDEEGEGWQAVHYVAVIGAERVVEGQVQSGTWMFQATNQPRYVTSGLLSMADETFVSEESE